MKIRHINSAAPNDRQAPTAHIADKSCVERAETVLVLGVLWSGLAVCMLGALSYDIAYWFGGFVRRTVKFDDYLTIETLAGQENSHGRVDGQGGDRDWRLQGHRRGDRETARRRGRFGGRELRLRWSVLPPASSRSRVAPLVHWPSCSSKAPVQSQDR